MHLYIVLYHIFFTEIYAYLQLFNALPNFLINIINFRVVYELSNQKFNSAQGLFSAGTAVWFSRYAPGNSMCVRIPVKSKVKPVYYIIQRFIAKKVIQAVSGRIIVLTKAQGGHALHSKYASVIRYFLSRLKSAMQWFCITGGFKVTYFLIILKYGRQLLMEYDFTENTIVKYIKSNLLFFNHYLRRLRVANCNIFRGVRAAKLVRVIAGTQIAGSYLSLFFLDLEYLTGLSVCVQINYIKRIVFSTRIQIFRVFFTCARRGWWLQWQVNIFSAFDAVAISLITKDVDYLLLFFCSIFRGIHFSNVSRVLVAYINILQALWIYARDCLRFAGIKILFRGKLGWRLLTRKKTFKLILGSVGSNSQFYNCIYRYNTVSTDTGVFGLSIFFFYKPSHLIIDKDTLRQLSMK